MLRYPFDRKLLTPRLLWLSLPVILGLVVILWYLSSRSSLESRHLLLAGHRRHGESVRLFALGDTGSFNANQRRVATAMERRCRELGGIDGLILLGDNFYQTGVDSLESPLWAKGVFDMYDGRCLSESPIFPILGNHDYKGNVSAQIQKSSYQKRWQMPHSFYQVTFGNLLQLVQIDTNKLTYCGDSARCSLDFLSHNLKRRRQFTWTIVSGHHPVDHGGDKHNGPWEWGRMIRSKILGSIICQKADLYLAGHVHLLQYFEQIGCSVHHFISGGGGADLYALNSDWHLQGYRNPSFGFLDLAVTAETISATFIDDYGRKLFRKEIKSKPPPRDLSVL